MKRFALAGLSVAAGIALLSTSAPVEARGFWNQDRVCVYSKVAVTKTRWIAGHGFIEYIWGYEDKEMFCFSTV